MQAKNVLLIRNTHTTPHDVINDYTLPDYIPDVKKLVNCSTVARLHNVFNNKNSVIYEGEVTYTILLICEDEHIKSVVYSEDFSVEASIDSGEVRCHEVGIESSTARLVSPRKISCKTKLVLFSKKETKLPSIPTYKPELSIASEDTIETLNKECEFMDVNEKSVSTLHASYDIDIPKEKEEIGSIVYCKVDTNINDQKFLEGKLYLRGETSVSVLYESTNATYVKHESKLPFSEIIDDISEFDGCICRVDIMDIRAEVRNNSFGEMKQIELDYTYDIVCRTYTSHTSLLINDIYSTEHDTKCSYGTAEPMKFKTVISSFLSVEGDFALDEDLTGEAEVIDCICSVDDSNVTSEKGRIVLIGTLKCDTIIKDEGITHYTYMLPLRFEKACDDDISRLYNEHSVKVTSCKVDLNNGKLYISCELMLGIMYAEIYERRYVESVELGEINDADVSPMIIYYPRKGETMWDVAKKFRVSCNDIMSANKLDTECLDGIKVLLLPRRRKKSVKNMII